MAMGRRPDRTKGNTAVPDARLLQTLAFTAIAAAEAIRKAAAMLRDRIAV